jgi:hypothetical protein
LKYYYQERNKRHKVVKIKDLREKLTIKKRNGENNV